MFFYLPLSSQVFLNRNIESLSKEIAFTKEGEVYKSELPGASIDLLVEGNIVTAEHIKTRTTKNYNSLISIVENEFLFDSEYSNYMVFISIDNRTICMHRGKEFIFLNNN